MMRADSEFSPAIAELLDSYTPVPQVEPAWEALRAQLSGRSHRRSPRQFVALAAALAVALFALAVATPLGGAVRRSLTDFSAWLQGAPGEPATVEEQRAFDEANQRSWASFPGSPQLRSLGEVEIDGATYRLIGFRSEGSLCLRVTARGDAAGSTLSCAPVSDLRTDEVPVRVLLADWGVGRGDKTKEIGFDVATSSHAQVTAGISADGVESVELVDDHGTHRVQTQSNAFIYVAEQPEVGQRVTQARALLTNGRSVNIPLTIAPFGVGGSRSFGTGANGEPGGPTKVERQIEGGRIGWLDRREERGEPLRDLSERLRAFNERPEFGRLMTPDPSSSERVVVFKTKGSVVYGGGNELVCAYVVTGETTGGGCRSAENLFPGKPFNSSTFIVGGGVQYATFSGIASDDVARMEAFTATGNTIPVPLADNAWLVRIAIARFPVKLVAYDSEGRVIGIEQTQPGEVTGRVVGAPIIDVKLDVQGVGSATLRANRTDTGGQCWFLRATGEISANMGGCVGRDWKVAPMRVGTLGTPPVIAVGRVRSDVSRVIFLYDDGSEATFTPDAEGYVFETLPPRLRAPERELIEIRGLDGDGKVVVRENLGG